MYHHQPNSSSSPPRQDESQGGLTRFPSAPGSFLTRAIASVVEGRPGLGGSSSGGGGGVPAGSPPSSHVGHGHSHSHRPNQYHQYFSADSSSLTSESTCKVSPSGNGADHSKTATRSSVGGFLEMGHGEQSLVRQKSSPAGFLSHLVSDNGFSITRGSGSYNSHSASGSGHGLGRLKSQLSFTRQDSLSQISEGSESGVEGISSDHRRQNSTHSYSPAGFGIQPWDNGNSIAFSGSAGKKVKNVDGDFYNCFGSMDSQFSMPQTNLEMASMDKLLNIPEDSVPCKIRAKRGCATHPRSIAERERRTRISGKLKKLQELVPNMDKQTSYADMLDLAVQHIKGLQNEVQRLHKELEHCTCGCKSTT